LSDVHSKENHHFYGKQFSDKHKENLGNSISISKRQYNDTIFMEILEEKLSFDTIEEITINIRKKYNITIDRNTISKIWNGKIKPIDVSICHSEKYKNLVSFKRKKIHKRKWTDDEIDYILSCKGLQSSIKLSNLFLEKFNKKITPGSISDIWNGKIRQMYKIRTIDS
jgi:hypothetical protein